MEFERGATCWHSPVWWIASGIYQLRSFQECSYGPLARAIPMMLAEEQLHIGFGANGLKRIANEPTTMATRPRPRMP